MPSLDLYMTIKTRPPSDVGGTADPREVKELLEGGPPSRCSMHTSVGLALDRQTFKFSWSLCSCSGLWKFVASKSSQTQTCVAEEMVDHTFKGVNAWSN